MDPRFRWLPLWCSQSQGSSHPVDHSLFLGGHLALSRFPLQYQGSFRPAPKETACLGLFLLRLLPWACSGRGPGSDLGCPRLMARPEEVSGCGLLLRMSQTHTRTSEVSGSGLRPQWLLHCTCSCGIRCLRPVPA